MRPLMRPGRLFAVAFGCALALGAPPLLANPAPNGQTPPAKSATPNNLADKADAPGATTAPDKPADKATLEAQRAAAQDAIKDLQERVVAAADSEKAHTAERDALAASAARLNVDTAAAAARYKTEQAKAASLISGLERMARMPPSLALVEGKPDAELLHTSLLLRRTLPAVTEAAQRLASELKRLNAMKAQLADEQARLDAAETALRGESARLDALLAQRQRELLAASSALQHLSEETKRLASTAKSVDELSDAATKLGGGARPIALAGKWLVPVNGTLARKFGDKDNYDAVSRGLTFRVAGESRITAPAAGRVVFAGPFRGYGQLVILDHGGGQHSLLAGFGRIDVVPGQDVAAGEPLGRAANSAQDKVEVYFERRKGSDAVNPLTP